MKDLHRNQKRNNTLSSFASSESGSSSSYSSSEDSEGGEWDNDTSAMVEVFVRSVRLPDFLLTHQEYSNTQVP